MKIKNKVVVRFIITFIISFFLIGYLISFILVYTRSAIPVILNDFWMILNILGAIFTIAISIIISAILCRRYSKNQWEKLILDDSQFIEKVKPLLENKSEILIDKVINLYGSKEDLNSELRKIIYKKIYEWATKYNFQIHGEKIILNPDKTSVLIDNLEKLYHKWKIGDYEKKV